MKIGLLYTTSLAHPNLMIDFINGLKSALHNELTQNVQLISESVGFGGNEKEVLEKTEKLLIIENVNVLIAYIDLRVLENIKNTIKVSGVFTIIVNPGANYPIDWTPTPNIVHLTLQHAYLCWLTGKAAASKQNIKGCIATTFYDGGYLHVAALSNAFMQHGGTITYNYLNNQTYETLLDITPLTNFLTEDKETNTLLCIIDSKPASKFYQKLHEYNSSKNLELFVSPMMLEQESLQSLDKGYNFSITGYGPWFYSLKNELNVDFINTIFNFTQKQATFFSLLGWEAGLVLKQILSFDKDLLPNGEKLINQLLSCTIVSPRGVLKLDPKTNYFVTQAFKCSTPKLSNNLPIETIDFSIDEWEKFTAVPTTGTVSGWTNTYLCY